jgi:PAS domain S-box-containing protein
VSIDTSRTSKRPAGTRLRAALLESQRRVLERIASGAPLEEVLDTLVRLVEEQADLRCAVLLADATQQRLRFIAAPHIPEDYRVGIEPYLHIAANMSACGTAAYRRQPVYTRDVVDDPLWEGLSEVAVRNGLRAIWSTPILSDSNTVLGTFAMYYGEPGLPTEEHIQLIDMATQMARLAIEAKRDDDVLRTVFENAPTGMMITDLTGNIVRSNNAFANMLGYATAELDGKGIVDIVETNDYPELVREALSNQRELSRNRSYRTRNGAVLWAVERVALRRDSTGAPCYILTQARQMNETGRNPLQQLSSREREVLALVISGRKSKEIAVRFGISPATVDTYRSRIAVKLGIKDLPGLVRFAIDHGIAGL